MDATLEQLRGRVEALAVRLAKPGTRGRNGCEFDDLVQEGMIDAWQAIQRGITPTDQHIRGRMLDYIKWLGRHAPTEYGTMLPIEDLDVPEPREEGEDDDEAASLLQGVSGD